MTNVSTLDELVNKHQLAFQEAKGFYQSEEDIIFTKDNALEQLKMAKEAKSLVDQFYAIDTVINKYHDLTNDTELLTEIRKFEPILRLIKSINKFQEDQEQKYNDAKTFFLTQNSN
jgi:hypothetical protein